MSVLLVWLALGWLVLGLILGTIDPLSIAVPEGMSSVILNVQSLPASTFSGLHKDLWQGHEQAVQHPRHILSHYDWVDLPRKTLMEPEEIRAIVQKARQAWMMGDAEALAALFTSSGKLIVPGQTYQGVAAIRAAASDFFSTHSDVKIEIRQIIVEGSQAMLEWHWEDTEIATGKQTQADDAIAIDFQSGQISRWREYIDTANPKSP